MSKSFSEYKEEELVDIKAIFVCESGDAICVKLTEDSFGKEAERHWLPKSLTRDNEDGTYTIPDWLAHKKGLE